MKKCFPVHTSSILHGALVGAGSLWPHALWQPTKVNQQATVCTMRIDGEWKRDNCPS
jgi:hypothetical protein